MPTLDIPDFYVPGNAEVWGYAPDLGALLVEAQRYANDYGLSPAATDALRVHLLLIDGQFDFTHPQGTLYVGGRSGDGAIKDCQRTAEFIYRNAGRITHITPTLDTHVPFQIFFPSFWVDSTGSHPDPFQFITTADVIAGKFLPHPAMGQLLAGGNYPWVREYAQHYCRSLEQAGKYQLYLWPFHCQLGSVGHALNGLLEEAIKFHAFARQAQVAEEMKGNSPFTECYSILGPEVEVSHDKRPIGQKNTRFIDTLLSADVVVVAGQAASHCVSSSVDDLLAQIVARDPQLAAKVYLMRDCTSAVTVPDGKGGFVADFTDNAEAAFRRYTDNGMHVVESTTPMEDWPGINLAA